MQRSEYFEGLFIRAVNGNGAYLARETSDKRVVSMTGTVGM
jgi:hypothetical protein